MASPQVRVRRAPSTPLETKECPARIFFSTGSGERVIKHFARGNLDIDIEPKNDNFAYVKAIRGCGKLGAVRALTNPIYFQKEEEEDN